MSESGPKKRGCVLGCLQRGCCGCLVVVALVVLVVIASGAYFAVSEPDAEPASDVLERDLSAEAQVAPLLGATAMPDAGRRGRVELELEEGDFTVETAPEGATLRVEAEYDRATHELSESFVDDPEGTWHYGVTFKGRGSLLRALVAGSRESPTVKIFLPKGVPMDLTVKFSKGKTRLELGGLALTTLDGQFSLGEHEVRFDEPLTSRLESLWLRGSMGGLEVAGLGNASPRQAYVTSSMSELRVDLRGAWQAPADVNVHVSMGGGVVEAPPEVPLVGEVTHRGGAPELLPAGAPVGEEGPPGVRLNTHFDFGEIEIRR